MKRIVLQACVVAGIFAGTAAAQTPTASPTPDAIKEALENNMEESLGRMFRMGGGKGEFPPNTKHKADGGAQSADAVARARKQIEDSDEPDFVKDAKRLLLDMSTGPADLMRQAEEMKAASE